MASSTSVAENLRRLLTEPKYSDTRILCDGGELGGVRAVLAARSKVLDAVLYTDSGPVSELDCGEISKSVMQLILEFLYTGAIGEGTLTNENAISAYYAADRFGLTDLQDEIVAFVKNMYAQTASGVAEDSAASTDAEFAVELLNQAAAKMSLGQQQQLSTNQLFDLLAKHVAVRPLESIAYEQMSARALEVLLCQTLAAKDQYFATTEYGVIRFLVLWAAKHHSQPALQFFETKLPPADVIDQNVPPSPSDEQDLTLQEYQPTIRKMLEPIVRYIDLKLIRPDILENVIEPLDIVPEKMLLQAYKHHSRSQGRLLTRRGSPPLRWSSTAKGPDLTVDPTGTIVEAPSNVVLHQSARAVEPIVQRGLHEWDVVLERTCGWAWVGVCVDEGANYAVFLGGQPTGWMLGSNSECSHNGVKLSNYVESSFDGRNDVVITVHLDMTEHTLAFSVDGVRGNVVYKDLPGKLYPAVSLIAPGRFRIRSRG